MGRSRGRSRQSAGFTMVELMIVVAIIAMMTTVVGVSVDALLPGERLNASIRNLASELRNIRTQAISRGMEFRLTYDLDNQRYCWSTPFSIEGGVLRQERDEEWESDDRVYFPWVKLAEGVEFEQVWIAGETYSGGEVYVVFDPVGTATDHSIVLAQPQFESRFTIEVMPLTGLTRMHDDLYFRAEPTDSDFD